MKLLLLFASLILFQPHSMQAQSKQKAQRAFLKQLNTVLKISTRNVSTYDGIMTIDSAFTIKEDILSVTVRYTKGSSFKRVRMTAPVAGIDTVRYDLHLILEYKDDVVTVYESEPGSEVLTEVSKGGWFDIGAPLPEDVSYQQNLQKAVDKLMRYY